MCSVLGSGSVCNYVYLVAVNARDDAITGNIKLFLGYSCQSSFCVVERECKILWANKLPLILVRARCASFSIDAPQRVRLAL